MARSPGARQVRAAMMLAPMAMDLADKGLSVKIVDLGHRSRAVMDQHFSMAIP